MMQPDDPPFLSVGTEVSAKYKGAFCEAKVHKVVKCVKIKVTFKGGLGSHVVSDEQVKGVLKVGSTVKAAHPERANTQEAIIAKIQDCSQYTVVFDDGDITTLRRSSLCLKSGRHFAESESLDQLPLTHPEHFGSPVVGGGTPGRRGGARRHKNASSRLNLGGASGSDCSDSSGEEADVHKTHRSRRDEWEHDISKVVCVEACDKKKQRDNWFPGLVVAPTAQDTVRIDTRKDWLVRSFQDGRYYTVPKKEATVFTKEVGAKATLGSLKAAVDKAMEYLTTDVLPPHWDRDLLFGMDVSEQDTDGTESDESDDEPREEKDHFVAQLYKFMEECGTPINKGPTIANRDLDLYKLFRAVQKLGGFNRVLNQNQLKVVAHKMNLSSLGSQGPTLIKAAYKRYLHNFEDFYRKLGCTMVSSPRRASRPRPRSGGRSLIRDCDRVDKSPHGAGEHTRSGVRRRRE